MNSENVNLAFMQERMTRNEMKNINGAVAYGGGCMQEFEYDCHKIRTPYPCCEGLVCADNATNTGTICISASQP
jgi:hypothetical protein